MISYLRQAYKLAYQANCDMRLLNSRDSAVNRAHNNLGNIVGCLEHLIHKTSPELEKELKEWMENPDKGHYWIFTAVDAWRPPPTEGAHRQFGYGKGFDREDCCGEDAQ